MLVYDIKNKKNKYTLLFSDYHPVLLHFSLNFNTLIFINHLGGRYSASASHIKEMFFGKGGSNFRPVL